MEAKENLKSLEQHSFYTSDAINYGTDEAIILYNLRYWLKKNLLNETNIYKGRVWTYNTAKAFAELLPYFTEKQIYKKLKKLQDEGILIIEHFSQNKFDRTRWFSINEEQYKTCKKSINYELLQDDEDLFLQEKTPKNVKTSEKTQPNVANLRNEPAPAVKVVKNRDLQDFTTDSQNGEMDFPNRGNGILQSGSSDFPNRGNVYKESDINTDVNTNNKLFLQNFLKILFSDSIRPSEPLLMQNVVNEVEQEIDFTFVNENQTLFKDLQDSKKAFRFSMYMKQNGVSDSGIVKTFKAVIEKYLQAMEDLESADALENFYKFKYPLSFSDYIEIVKRLKELNPKLKVPEICEIVNNKLYSLCGNATYVKKYKSAYLAVLNWAKSDVMAGAVKKRKPVNNSTVGQNSSLFFDSSKMNIPAN